MPCGHAKNGFCSAITIGAPTFTSLVAKGVSPAAKQKALIEQASAQLSEPSDTDLVPNFALPDQLQPKDGEQFSLALVRKNADGTGSIVDGTNNVAAVHAVLAILGKALKANAIKAAEVNATQKAEAQKKQNIAALTAVMEEMGTVASAKANFTPQLRVSVPADELIPA